MNPQKRAFKGIWIPKAIWLDKSLTWTEKCLLGEIASFDDESESGGCFATNKFLADEFGASENSLKVMLSRLKSKGFLVDVGTHQKRVLRLTAINRTGKQPLTVRLTAINQNAPPLIYESTRENTGSVQIVEKQSFKEEEEIYQIYPRKVGKPDALKAIKKALEKEGFESLREKTRKYSDIWLNAESLQFCPHPATWFRQERFSDDPSGWNRPSIPEVPIWKQIESLKAKISTHPANREFVRHDPNCGHEKKQEYRNLKMKLASLEAEGTYAAA